MLFSSSSSLTELSDLNPTPAAASPKLAPPAIPTMALVTSAPGLPPPPRRHSTYSDEENMSTIPDPRSRAMSPTTTATDRSSPHHPDLNDEVATLSTKLINAINYQTNLDDTLSATRCELDSSRDRLQQLEMKVKTHEEQISQGILVEKSVADAEKAKVIADWEEERRRRIEVENQKKGIELELETLTTALFEEANRMVTSAREEARKDLDVVNRRNEQLKSQVADTEVLLKSHQEQLAQLKLVMEQMSDDRTNSTAPPTPGLSKVDSKEHFGVESLENLNINEDLPPSYPTSFTHLLHPVLRTDLASYDDFISLVRLAKASSAPGSRMSSGSYGSLGIGLGGLGGLGLYTKNPSTTTVPSTASNSSASNGTSPVTPNTPLSATSTSSVPPTTSVPLCDTKFYKRALSEDIEPCLRLDIAPGISWITRRSLLKSMCEGSLVVEPMPSSTKKFALTFSCSMCGENRNENGFSRNHRFKISESNNAQRYPLCRYCLGRIRSCCDFVGFLRMLKDGHWRAEGDEAEKAAWEESVRLREQMFWCRMGGGVLPGPLIPLSKDDKSSPRSSEDARREQEAKISADFEKTGELQPKDVTPITEPAVILEAHANRTPPSTDVESIASSTESRRPSIESRPSTSSTSNEARRRSPSTESQKHSVSFASRRPSSSSVESKKSLASIVASRPPMPTAIKRPSTTESKRPTTLEFKQPSTETQRPSTAPSTRSSKVSNMRKMFEQKKETTEGTWQAAQDDAAAPPPLESKTGDNEEYVLTRDSSQTTLKVKSSGPGDSDNDQKIPGSFD